MVNVVVLPTHLRGQWWSGQTKFRHSRECVQHSIENNSCMDIHISYNVGDCIDRVILYDDEWSIVSIFYFIPGIEENTTIGIWIHFANQILVVCTGMNGVMVGETWCIFLIVNLWPMVQIFERNITNLKEMQNSN